MQISQTTLRLAEENNIKCWTSPSTEGHPYKTLWITAPDGDYNLFIVYRIVTNGCMLVDQSPGRIDAVPKILSDNTALKKLIIFLRIRS